MSTSFQAVTWALSRLFSNHQPFSSSPSFPTTTKEELGSLRILKTLFKQKIVLTKRQTWQSTGRCRDELHDFRTVFTMILSSAFLAIEIYPQSLKKLFWFQNFTKIGGIVLRKLKGKIKTVKSLQDRFAHSLVVLRTNGEALKAMYEFL